MPITTLIFAGALSIVPSAPAQLEVDFAQTTTGIAYRIEVKLFNVKGKQKGNSQTIDLGTAADVDDLMGFFATALGNTGLTTMPVAGTKKVVIKGTVADFKRLEYSTLIQNGDKWIRNDNLKGPTLVGKHMAHAPSFVVNPKPF